MGLLIYAAPNGSTYQFPEGEQPEGYTLAEVQFAGSEPPKATTTRKRRTPANKRVTDAPNKG